MHTYYVPAPIVNTISYGISLYSDSCSGSKLILKSSLYPWGNRKTEKLVILSKAHSYYVIDPGSEPRQSPELLIFITFHVYFMVVLMLLHSLSDLPYNYGTLGSNINAQIMRLQHSKHHVICVNNLNASKEIHKEALVKVDVRIQVALQPALNFRWRPCHSYHFMYEPKS